MNGRFERERMEHSRVALAPFLADCPEVLTLGVRPGFEDYSAEERQTLRKASRIFFPTPRFVSVFHAAGLPCFPSYYSYRYQRSRLLQNALFQWVGIPHLGGRAYYGPRQKEAILRDFPTPFLLTGPFARPDTVHVVNCGEDLRGLRDRYNPVLVRPLVSWRRQVRLVFLRHGCIGAQVLTASRCGTSTWEPVSTGGKNLDSVIRQTRGLLRGAQIDDILVHWGHDGESWKLIEMLRPPLRVQTPSGVVRRHQLVGRLIRESIL